MLAPSRLLLIPALLSLWTGAGAEGAEPSASLRHRLAQLVRPEFEVFAWSPAFHVSAGLIYDNRLEPCSLEIAALEKQAAADAEDAAVRARLGWLLNRHGAPGSANRWLAEAVQILQRRLAKKPDEEEALIQMALLQAGSEEGLKTAVKATELYPQSWQAWDALARQHWRRMEIRVVGNLPATPLEMSLADFERLEKALAAHASDPDLAAAMFQLDAERETHAKRATIAAPQALEPLLNHIGGRMAVAVIIPTLHRMVADGAPDRAAFDKETLRLLDRAVPLAKGQPEALGVIGFLQLQLKITMAAAAAAALQARIARPPEEGLEALPKAPPPIKIEPRTMPVFLRLRELIDGPDAAKSAVATEAYAGLLTLIPLIGGETKPVPELPELLAAASVRAPERPLLWDLWLGEKFAAAARGELSSPVELRQLAQTRLKRFPTARSHALLAFASRGEEARREWLEAAKIEPTNIEFLLNLAAAMLMDDQSPQVIEATVAIVQRATELSYQESSWQKERLDAFRLRTYAVCLIFRGEMERAHALLIERLQQFPGDMASREIRDALVSE